MGLLNLYVILSEKEGLQKRRQMWQHEYKKWHEK